MGGQGEVEEPCWTRADAVSTTRCRVKVITLLFVVLSTCEFSTFLLVLVRAASAQECCRLQSNESCTGLVAFPAARWRGCSFPKIQCKQGATVGLRLQLCNSAFLHFFDGNRLAASVEDCLLQRRSVPGADLRNFTATEASRLDGMGRNGDHAGSRKSGIGCRSE